MKDEELFFLSNLERKSNAVVGFIVIQSILLANNLANQDFSNQIKATTLMGLYVMIAHTVLVIVAVISTILISVKTNKLLGDNKNNVFASQSAVIKVILVITFGVLPLIVIWRFHMISLPV